LHVLWSENTTPLLKHEPPDNNDVLMDENFKTIKENKNIKSEQAKQPAMTFKRKRSTDGKRLCSKAFHYAISRGCSHDRVV
jgi:hypothetical protein